jgi:hypothetical protein
MMDVLIGMLLLVVFAGLRVPHGTGKRADLLAVTLILAAVIFITQIS